MYKRAISLTLAAVMVCVAALNGVSDANAAKKATIKTKKISIKVGEKKKIKIANKVKKAKYKFTTSKKAVATVTAKGVVKGKKKGNAKITVKEILNKKTRKLGTISVKVSVKRWSRSHSRLRQLRRLYSRHIGFLRLHQRQHRR